jgi:hypothetical protein
MTDHVRQAERLYGRARQSFESDGAQSGKLPQLFGRLHPHHAQQYSLIEREYLRFMALKVLHTDTSVPTQMSPPAAVDLLWHTHVLVSAFSLPPCLSLQLLSGSHIFLHSSTTAGH